MSRTTQLCCGKAGRLRAVIEQLVRSRKWANRNTCDRLPGRPLGPSGENVSGKAAARCDVEGSERQLLLQKRQSRSLAGRGEKKGGLRRVN